MAISPRIELRTSQALVMTPQLQQAIRLLQMNNIELTSYIEGELEQNPLLERESPNDDSQDSPEERASSEDSPDAWENPAEALAPDAAGPDAPPDQPDLVTLAESDSGSAHQDAAPEADHQNTFDTDEPFGSGGEDGTGSDLVWQESVPGGGEMFGDMPEQAPVANEETLRAHLLMQLSVEISDPVDRHIGTHLIGSLDDAGYFAGETGSMALALGCPEARIEKVLEQLKQFDPAGVFADSLAECLALQLREKNRFDPAMEILIDNLELLGAHRFDELRALCSVDKEDFLEMVQEIKALNPKPASQFDHTIAETMIPDVMMRQNKSGEWLIELNSDALPRVLVNSQYYAIIRKKTHDKAEKEYITEQFNTANWLVKSLHQRAQTILKVATELVDQQAGFFQHGVEYLKPMTLRDVALAIEMHESTVSRVTSNKYIATPRGIFELKYFFTSALAYSEGEAKSSETVRFRIRDMIDDEPPDQILSDDAICDMLRADGIEIARRTVAKYRDAMHIPSSVRRRREKVSVLSN